MAVFIGSRYDGSENTLVEVKTGVDDNGDDTTVFKDYLHDRTVVKLDDIDDNFFVEPTVDTDALDGLAFKHGKRDRLWWLIADINDLGGEDVIDLLEPATENNSLYIPTKEGFEKY